MQHRYDAVRVRADDAEAPLRIASAVDEVLAKRTVNPRLRVILNGDALPAKTIAALIAGLRRMRERGGAVEAIPESRAVRDTLLLTRLDSVFAFPIVPEETRPPRPARPLGRTARSAAADVVGLNRNTSQLRAAPMRMQDEHYALQGFPFPTPNANHVESIDVPADFHVDLNQLGHGK